MEEVSEETEKLGGDNAASSYNIVPNDIAAIPQPA